jgi:hypothetical protein
MSTAGLAARLTSHSSTLWTLQNHNLRLAQLGGRGSWRETLVMEKDHDNFTRCCRPSLARRNARKSQAAFALVSLVQGGLTRR